MQLFLTDAHKQHLELITKQPTSVFQDVCQITTNFIKNGPNMKSVFGLSQQIDVPPQSLRHAIEGLVKLLIESYKNKLNAEDFSCSLQALGFQEEQQELLLKLYSDKGKWLGVAESLCIPPHFSNLEWRFEVQVASRSLLHQLTRLLTMRLYLKDGENILLGKGRSNLHYDGGKQADSIQCHTLQIDPVGLLHITEVLEQALAEGSSRHCRRLQHSLE